MDKISLKTAYTDSLPTLGSSCPADGAVFLLEQLKVLLIGHKLNKILNTWPVDYRFSAKSNQILQQSIVNDIEWEGPFVFVINEQYLFIHFWSPECYRIGINSENITEIKDAASMNVLELKTYGHNGKFVDISYLYGNQVIGQIVQDLYAVADNRYNNLSAVIIELKNGICLVVSEDIDDPMLRVYQNIEQAQKAIADQQEDFFRYER